MIKLKSFVLNLFSKNLRDLSPVVLNLMALVVGSFLISSCHLLNKDPIGVAEVENQELSKGETAKRQIASRCTSFQEFRHISDPNLGFLSFCFKRIPAGQFKMGFSEGETYKIRNEEPKEVEISKDFLIMTKEVTQKQWYLVMRNHPENRLRNPSYFRTREHCGNEYVELQGVGLCPNHPVERVSWYDVQVFIKNLNDLQGWSNCNGNPKDPIGCYRLPTEAEWEYAVRAGRETVYFFGNDPNQLGRFAIYNKNSGQGTHPGGTKEANPWGLYDVYGNVSEWVQDKWHRKLPGGRDPLVVTGYDYVLRGGSWNNSEISLGSANLVRSYIGKGSQSFGFRLVNTE
ncbi:MAG: formylglycine-generating enzyme family protein [Bdellovibrionaceae bacterium]|nr:formylglycine-generating enzyme family protein [Pseudobdellovibrionaceae bacterium]